MLRKRSSVWPGLMPNVSQAGKQWIDQQQGRSSLHSQESALSSLTPQLLTKVSETRVGEIALNPIPIVASLQSLREDVVTILPEKLAVLMLFQRASRSKYLFFSAFLSYSLSSLPLRRCPLYSYQYSTPLNFHSFKSN